VTSCTHPSGVPPQSGSSYVPAAADGGGGGASAASCSCCCAPAAACCCCCCSAAASCSCARSTACCMATSRWAGVAEAAAAAAAATTRALMAAQAPRSVIGWRGAGAYCASVQRWGLTGVCGGHAEQLGCELLLQGHDRSPWQPHALPQMQKDQICSLLVKQCLQQAQLYQHRTMCCCLKAACKASNQ
jgi:hypothetical protein